MLLQTTACWREGGICSLKCLHAAELCRPTPGTVGVGRSSPDARPDRRPAHQAFELPLSLFPRLFPVPMLLMDRLLQLCRACRVVRAFGAEAVPTLKNAHGAPHHHGRDALRVYCTRRAYLSDRPFASSRAPDSHVHVDANAKPPLDQGCAVKVTE